MELSSLIIFSTAMGKLLVIFKIVLAGIHNLHDIFFFGFGSFRAIREDNKQRI